MRNGFAEYLVLAVAIPVLTAFTLIAFGQWTIYSHDNAHLGLKFAPSTHAGCGVELVTQQGQDEGLEPFYCE